MLAFLRNLWRNIRRLLEKGVLVKVVRLGKQTQEFYLPRGAQVIDLLRAGNFGRVTEEIRVNNVVRDEQYALASGDVVTLIPRIDGG